jgi:hypothetical protein
MVHDPGRLARRGGGRAPFSSLGEEGTRQRDGAAGTVLPGPYPGVPRLYGPSDSECTTPGSPCEGSQGAVHPVIPLETLRETLVDGPVEDGRAFHRSISAVVSRLRSRAARPRSILR